MYSCRYCSAAGPEGMHFTCKKCGHPFEECGRCGTMGKRDYSPCATCGKRPGSPLLFWIGLPFALIVLVPLLALALLLALPIALVLLVLFLIALPFIGLEWLRKRNEAVDRALFAIQYGAAMLGIGVGYLIGFAIAIAILLALVYLVALMFKYPGGRPPWAG
jgi:hypothetical protein